MTVFVSTKITNSINQGRIQTEMLAFKRYGRPKKSPQK